MLEKITSLEDLKRWNENPTDELPILYDWFLDWFFEQLSDGNIELAKKANEEHIKFGMICNNFTREQSIDRVNKNMEYYAGYNYRWGDLLKKHKILTNE